MNYSTYCSKIVTTDAAAAAGIDLNSSSLRRITSNKLQLQLQLQLQCTDSRLIKNTKIEIKVAAACKKTPSSWLPSAKCCLGYHTNGAFLLPKPLGHRLSRGHYLFSSFLRQSHGTWPTNYTKRPSSSSSSSSSFVLRMLAHHSSSRRELVWDRHQQ